MDCKNTPLNPRGIEEKPRNSILELLKRIEINYRMESKNNKKGIHTADKQGSDRCRFELNVGKREQRE